MAYAGNSADLFMNYRKDDSGFGLGGLNGIKHTDVIGWENTTVGPAGNVSSRLSPQNGVQPVDPNILALREPFRQGRFLVKWLKAPPFFNAKMVEYLRFIFEDMVKSCDGIPENSIDKFEQTNGAVAAKASYPGIYKESGGDVTLKVFETTGMIVRKFLDYWISGISDRKTGVSHMYGKHLRSILPNKAGSLIYVLLGPTCRPEDIEFSCMWHEIFPVQEKTSYANSGGIGEAGSGQEVDVTFSGIYDRGPEIDLLAKKIVQGYNLYGQTFLTAPLPAYLYDGALYEDNGNLKTNIGVDMYNRIKQNSAIDDPIKGNVYNGDAVAQRDALRATGDMKTEWLNGSWDDNADVGKMDQTTADDSEAATVAP
jgi:hypothetical protein